MATYGKATLLDDRDQVRVTVRTRDHGYGYLLIGCGVVAVLLTPRDVIPHVWPGRPTHPVEVHVGPAGRG